MGDLMQGSSAQLPAEQSADVQQYLTFMLQQEMFGLNILPVKEIIEYGRITPVPLVPDYVRGVINLRGSVVPVIDLPARFGWQSSPVTKRSCIVIIEVENEDQRLDIGVVIDSVSEVLEVASANIGPAPSFGAKIRTDFIAGMARVHDDFIVLLNPAKVLSVEELSELKGSAQRPAEPVTP